ncbi:MAG: PIN domain-containing protein [Candidatus ainarchaeum sp.]|nr:PIN domain-containing protein [Candidatus ainarchaeum sp.]MDD3975790.1 PIN domain-containing protein [Candidatus ainarchaeum sp.]
MVKLNKVLIDTNVLIYMYENKKDIFDEVNIIIPDAEFFILDKVFEELSKVLKNKPNKCRLIINYLKKLLDLNKFKILEVNSEIINKHPKFQKIDNLLIYFSNKYIIYTNDKKLKDKIKKFRNRVLVLKNNGVLLS